EQALDYLDQAERQFAQRCTYPGCTIEASTDECAGFLVNAADGELHRQNCWPFVGRLCLAHMRQVVVPPDWWISETALSPAGFGSDLEKVGAGGDD
ncbi:MAG TPA: hypothetical protein VGT44_15135, partial [Ktedonobacteraceae bacterium]|nr:hypothetical protein [Ktedonobacteraceae bacterium]